jgi:hypothetical protein
MLISQAMVSNFISTKAVMGHEEGRFQRILQQPGNLWAEAGDSRMVVKKMRQKRLGLQE